MTRLRRFHLVVFATILSLVTVLNSSPSCAWNKSGHMVTAAIAYQDLERTGDQEVIAAVVAILKRNPNYNPSPRAKVNWLSAMQRAGIAAGTEEGSLFLFMQAARWPDDIRGTAEDCGACHYIDYRYTPGRSTMNPQAMPQDPNIETAYAQKVAILTDATQEAPIRAKALSWVFHLVGDVHQPLHAVSLFTAQRPKGDRGGNDFYIRAKEGGAVIGLHKYWDDLLIGSERFQTVRSRAVEIRTGFPRSTLSTSLTRTDFRQWAQRESYPAAVRFVYLNGNLRGALPRSSPLIVNGRKVYTPAGAPALPANYVLAAKSQGQQRAALAGYRLADLLREWFGDSQRGSSALPSPL